MDAPAERDACAGRGRRSPEWREGGGEKGGESGTRTRTTLRSSDFKSDGCSAVGTVTTWRFHDGYRRCCVRRDAAAWRAAGRSRPRCARLGGRRARVAGAGRAAARGGPCARRLRRREAGRRERVTQHSERRAPTLPSVGAASKARKVPPTGATRSAGAARKARKGCGADDRADRTVLRRAFAAFADAALKWLCGRGRRAYTPSPRGSLLPPTLDRMALHGGRTPHRRHAGAGVRDLLRAGW